MSTPPTPERILQTGLAFWPAKTLLSAIELGVFTELAHGPQSHDALAARLGLHARSSRDFLDTLHPNARGQRKIAGALAPHLAPILRQRAADVLPAAPH